MNLREKLNENGKGKNEKREWKRRIYSKKFDQTVDGIGNGTHQTLPLSGLDSLLGVRGTFLMVDISICSGATATDAVMAAVVGIPPTVIPPPISLCPGLVLSGINSLTFPQAMTLKKAFLKFSDRKA